MKEILAVLVTLSTLSCSPFASGNRGRFVYEVDYIQYSDGLEVRAADFIFRPKKDSGDWVWYKETPVYKSFAPKADSIVVRYWGTRKEWKKLNP